MARDTFLGFPSHALPYCYHHSYHFIDRLRFLSLFRITAEEHIRPEFIGVAVLGVPLVVILFYLVRIGVFLQGLAGLHIGSLQSAHPGGHMLQKTHDLRRILLEEGAENYRG